MEKLVVIDAIVVGSEGAESLDEFEGRDDDETVFISAVGLAHDEILLVDGSCELDIILEMVEYEDAASEAPVDEIEKFQLKEVELNSGEDLDEGTGMELRKSEAEVNGEEPVPITVREVPVEFQLLDVLNASDVWDRVGMLAVEKVNDAGDDEESDLGEEGDASEEFHPGEMLKLSIVLGGDGALVLDIFNEVVTGREAVPG
ncbi:hypothetical protein BGZ63DRAFT_427007 [Mariannaea sp. PMI_226]|nr:hypothetical protein BGZ63DRAFT_427007 [Mariannaea sp. PMI_226]